MVQSIQLSTTQFKTGIYFTMHYSTLKCDNRRRRARPLLKSAILLGVLVVTFSSSVGASPLNNMTLAPSEIPTYQPTFTPTLTPSDQPTSTPTYNPTDTPSFSSSGRPTFSPSNAPSGFPTLTPSDQPTSTPSEQPTSTPTYNPTDTPSFSPSGRPTFSPSNVPSGFPTGTPSHVPSSAPSQSPSRAPSTKRPTERPTTSQPSRAPSTKPTTSFPTLAPTQAPTKCVSGCPEGQYNQNWQLDMSNNYCRPEAELLAHQCFTCPPGTLITGSSWNGCEPCTTSRQQRLYCINGIPNQISSLDMCSYRRDQLLTGPAPVAKAHASAFLNGKLLSEEWFVRDAEAKCGSLEIDAGQGAIDVTVVKPALRFFDLYLVNTGDLPVTITEMERPAWVQLGDKTVLGMKIAPGAVFEIGIVVDSSSIPDSDILFASIETTATATPTRTPSSESSGGNIPNNDTNTDQDFDDDFDDGLNHFNVTGPTELPSTSPTWAPTNSPSAAPSSSPSTSPTVQELDLPDGAFGVANATVRFKFEQVFTNAGVEARFLEASFNVYLERATITILPQESLFETTGAGTTNTGTGDSLLERTINLYNLQPSPVQWSVDEILLTYIELDATQGAANAIDISDLPEWLTLMPTSGIMSAGFECVDNELAGVEATSTQEIRVVVDPTNLPPGRHSATVRIGTIIQRAGDEFFHDIQTKVVVSVPAGPTDYGASTWQWIDPLDDLRLPTVSLKIFSRDSYGKSTRLLPLAEPDVIASSLSSIQASPNGLVTFAVDSDGDTDGTDGAKLLGQELRFLVTWVLVPDTNTTNTREQEAISTTGYIFVTENSEGEFIGAVELPNKANYLVSVTSPDGTQVLSYTASGQVGVDETDEPVSVVVNAESCNQNEIANTVTGKGCVCVAGFGVYSLPNEGLITTCRACPPGFYSSGEGRVCMQCASGMFSAQAGAEECARCEGNAEPNRRLGATACEQCDEGERVLDESVDGICIPCGTNKKVFGSQCLCDTQFYLDEKTEECVKCPDWGFCAFATEKTVVPRQGYWRTTWNRLKFVPCVGEDTCVGVTEQGAEDIISILSNRAVGKGLLELEASTGVGSVVAGTNGSSDGGVRRLIEDSEFAVELRNISLEELMEYGVEEGCAPGFSGPICRDCEFGYLATLSGECKPCSPYGETMGLLFLAFIASVLCLLYFIKRTIASGGVGKRREIMVLKIIISHLQLVGMANAFPLQWPTWTVAFLDSFQTFTSAGNVAVSVRCVAFHLTEPGNETELSLEESLLELNVGEQTRQSQFVSTADVFYYSSMTASLLPFMFALCAYFYWHILVLWVARMLRWMNERKLRCRKVAIKNQNPNTRVTDTDAGIIGPGNATTNTTANTTAATSPTGGNSDYKAMAAGRTSKSNNISAKSSLSSMDSSVNGRAQRSSSTESEGTKDLIASEQGLSKKVFVSGNDIRINSSGSARIIPSPSSSSHRNADELKHQDDLPSPPAAPTPTIRWLKDEPHHIEKDGKQQRLLERPGLKGSTAMMKSLRSFDSETAAASETNAVKNQPGLHVNRHRTSSDNGVHRHAPSTDPLTYGSQRSPRVIPDGLHIPDFKQPARAALSVSSKKERWRRFVVANMVVLFVVQPWLTRVGLQFFSCSEVDDRTFLEVAFSMQCWTPEHARIAWLGYVIMILFAIGIPVLTVFLLYFVVLDMFAVCFGHPPEHPPTRHESLLKHRATYGFMYDGYREECFYWETVVMARKTAFAAITVTLQPVGVDMQIFAGLIVVIVAGTAQLTFKPYEQRMHLNAIESLSLFVTTGTLFCGAFMLSNNTNDQFKTFASVAVVVLNSLFFLIVIIALRREINYNAQRVIREVRVSVTTVGSAAGRVVRRGSRARKPTKNNHAASTNNENNADYNINSYYEEHDTISAADMEEAQYHQRRRTLSGAAAYSYQQDEGVVEVDRLHVNFAPGDGGDEYARRSQRESAVRFEQPYYASVTHLGEPTLLLDCNGRRRSLPTMPPMESVVLDATTPREEDNPPIYVVRGEPVPGRRKSNSTGVSGRSLDVCREGKEAAEVVRRRSPAGSVSSVGTSASTNEEVQKLSADLRALSESMEKQLSIRKSETLARQ